ncbi:Hypothetical predicted protein [Podarcis lilfordi]|uniref:Uncharacterized protein n=1 Tax=Podarcis lilfordi TaxID=74358 RepID=A0AA35PMM4_9SAUR|nr:Hypothetical predicted protein [Podarcis lilfordi]
MFPPTVTLPSSSGVPQMVPSMVSFHPDVPPCFKVLTRFPFRCSSDVSSRGDLPSSPSDVLQMFPSMVTLHPDLPPCFHLLISFHLGFSSTSNPSPSFHGSPTT